MRAKYNVYRNLHKQLFSIRLRGLIISYESNVVLNECEFVLKSNSRDIVRVTGRKNVHAWITCKSYKVVAYIDVSKLEEIYYCPYTVDFFCYKEYLQVNQEFVKVLKAERVYCINNKIFIDKVSG